MGLETKILTSVLCVPLVFHYVTSIVQPRRSTQLGGVSLCMYTRNSQLLFVISAWHQHAPVSGWLTWLAHIYLQEQQFPDVVWGDIPPFPPPV